MTTFTYCGPAARPGRIVLAAALASLLAGPAAAQQPPPVATTARFELTSNPRVALHHLLIDWAMAEAGEWPPYAPPITEREGWSAELNADETRVWEDAVTAYDAARHRSLLFDDGLLAVWHWAAGTGSRDAIPATDRPLADALDAALPVYMRHWWPEHDRRNRAWIRALAPTLREVEGDVVPRMEAAYGGTWPAERIPLDIVPYANAVGAYSTTDRLVISSVDRDNGMPQALELVFHEASHTDAMEAPLRSNVDTAFRAAGGEAPGRFWHDVIFYTTGEIVRIVMQEHGNAYRHYGETAGVYSRGERWDRELPALEAHWGPFLRSGSADGAARRAAMEEVARRLRAGEEPGGGR